MEVLKTVLIKFFNALHNFHRYNAALSKMYPRKNELLHEFPVPANQRSHTIDRKRDRSHKPLQKAPQQLSCKYIKLKLIRTNDSPVVWHTLFTQILWPNCKAKKNFLPFSTTISGRKLL